MQSHTLKQLKKTKGEEEIEKKKRERDLSKVMTLEPNSTPKACQREEDCIPLIARPYWSMDYITWGPK